MTTPNTPQSIWKRKTISDTGECAHCERIAELERELEGEYAEAQDIVATAQRERLAAEQRCARIEREAIDLCIARVALGWPEAANAIRALANEPAATQKQMAPQHAVEVAAIPIELASTAVHNDLITIAYITPNGFPKHFSDVGSGNGFKIDELRKNWRPLVFREDAEAAIKAAMEEVVKWMDKYETQQNPR